MYNGRLFNQITAQHTSTTKRAQSSGNLCKNVTCPNNHLPLIHTTAPLCYSICTYHGVMFAHIGHCSDEIYIFFRFTQITTRLRTAPLCFRIFTYPGVIFAHIDLRGDRIYIFFRFTQIKTRHRTAPLCFRIFTYLGVIFAHIGLCGHEMYIFQIYTNDHSSLHCTFMLPYFHISLRHICI